MKKVFLGALGAISLMTLASCGGEGNTGDSSMFSKFDGELERNVTIRVLENDIANELGYFKDLLNAFNEKYKEYGITAVDAQMDQYSNLEEDGPYGYGPDVLYQANDVLMKYVQGRHILPLPIDRFEAHSKISKNAWDVFESKVGSDAYNFAVPVNIQSPMLYYRKDLLPADWETSYDKNNNQIPDMIETWTALYKYSNDLHKANSSKYGYMQSVNDSYFSTGYVLSYGGYIFGDKNTNPKDIGIDKGDSYLGLKVVRQLAASMNEDCIDDSITVSAYSKLASGEYFATMTTPDVKGMFIDELTKAYQRDGLSKADAQKKAKENLVMTTAPMLPKSGDLNDIDGEHMPMTVMGGIHGYAISSYTKAPKASLAFIDFATSYEMMVKRSSMLGIVPVRSDANSVAGGVSKVLFDNLESGYLVPMPSIREVGQIWTPLKTLFTDLSKDPYRQANEYKYATDEQLKAAVSKTRQEIYDSIYTLS